MFCRKCGKELPDGARFCNRCGTPCEESIPQEQDSVKSAPAVAPPQITKNYEQQALADTIIIKKSAKPKYLVPIIAVAGILMVVIIWFFMDNAKKPGHVSESGDYTLQLQETFQFKSTKSSIRFEEVTFGEPQYDSSTNALTAPVTFVFRVDIPGKKYKDAYADWLNNFSVNGIQATNSVRIYRPESDDCYLVYSVHYDSVPADQSYLLTCKVNSRLSLHFSYDQTFWENVDYAQAIAVGQAVLDEEYGIKYVDWQNGANALSYTEGKVYCMTGKVASCGEYMWGITDQYYIILTAKGALVDTHCYFSRDEWNRSPAVKAGDIVTFYGTFEFESFGWNFNNCTFTSPAGAFTVDGNRGSVSQTDFPSEDFSSDDDTAYQYGEDGMLASISIDTSFPFGYYEKRGGGAIEIGYTTDESELIYINFYENRVEGFYGGSWLQDEDCSAYFDWFDITKSNWSLSIDGTQVDIFISSIGMTVTAHGSLGNLSADQVSGTYYLKQQAIQP